MLKLPLHLRAFAQLLWLTLSVSGCHKHEDCHLYDMCPGDLIAKAADLAGENRDACTRCLERDCQDNEPMCSADLECNYTSRCVLTRSPTEYQECIKLLYDHGLTTGHEERQPWEGRTEQADGGLIERFGRCVHFHCKEECAAGARFSCREDGNEYERLELEIAARMYPGFGPAAYVELRVCDNDRGCESEWRPADQHGMVHGLRVPAYASPQTLYFEIRPTSDSHVDFPLTLYYPGRLGATGPQLLAIYLVSGLEIAVGNGLLGRDAKVLTSLAQSLILTDSCVWEEKAAPGLRILVEDAYVPQCHDSLCQGNACPPCVWYARPMLPDLTTRMTTGAGAGIVGLPERMVTIRVEQPARDEQAKGRLISKRTIRMQAGAMTIARTFPYRQSGDDDVASP